MFKKLLVYVLLCSTTIAFQSQSWAHGRDRDRGQSKSSDSSDSTASNILLIGLALSLSVGISQKLSDYSFSSSTDVAQIDDFLKNEETVVLQQIQPTESGQQWTLARSSDQESFTINVFGKQGAEHNRSLVEHHLSVDVTPQGTILSNNEEVVLFMVNETGKRELSNL